MHTSRVIEIDGVFVGAAIGLPGAPGWRFAPADARLRHLAQSMAASFEELERRVRSAYITAKAKPNDAIADIAAAMPHTRDAA